MFARSRSGDNQEGESHRASRLARAVAVFRRNKTSPLPSNQHDQESHEGSYLEPSLRATFCTRLVKPDDDELAAIALATKHGIDWRSVVLSARVGPARWRRVDTLGDFAVYTRQESQQFAVLAVGTVPGCVAEIVNVMQSRDSAQYAQQMEAIFEDQFKQGSFVHRVEINADMQPQQAAKRDVDLVDLSVKSLTFNKARWLARHEEWCYLDAVYQHSGGSGAVEKFMTTMRPEDIVAGPSGGRTKYVHGVVCGYLFRPGAEDAPHSNQDDHGEPKPTAKPNVTRVTFYAEMKTPKQFSFPLSNDKSRSMEASDKTIKQRLLLLGQSTARLIALVRRQRLGVQVLVDCNRFLPPTNAPCKVCTKMLLVAKQCRLCGHGVCGDCSTKRERARYPRGSATIDVSRVRVCATCMDRVDSAEYSHLSQSSLLGTHIVADPSDAKPAAAMLKDLLQDALLNAPSPSRKACVMSVIRCVLDHESERDSSAPRSHNSSFSVPSPSPSLSPVLLTPTSSDTDYVKALDYVDIEPMTVETARLRSDDHRSYQLDSTGDGAVPTPVPDNEELRVKAVQRVDIPEISGSMELEILCDVAVKEMGCTTSVISIIDSDTYHVVATNSDELRGVKLPRDMSMCSHTIMEDRPLIVAHPQADIRFSRIDGVAAFGVRYYCAFPLKGESDQLIGAMCCFNTKSIEITESQLAAFGKLTTTASKVVKMQTNRARLRKLSSSSDSTSTTSSRTGGRDSQGTLATGTTSTL